MRYLRPRCSSMSYVVSHWQALVKDVPEGRLLPALKDGAPAGLVVGRKVKERWIWAPPHFVPETKEDLEELEDSGFLTEDVARFRMEMSALNIAGMLTIDSQSGLVERGVSKTTGKNYVIRQKEYVQGIVYRDIVSDLCDELRANDVLHHFGHLSHRYAEPVTVQNGETVTMAANQSAAKMASYLAGFEYEGERIFSKAFLDDIRENGQTMIAWAHEFGPSFVTLQVRRALLSIRA